MAGKFCDLVVGPVQRAVTIGRPQTRAPTRPGVLGSVLVTAGAMLGIFAVVNSESHGILAASTDGELIAAIVLLTGFFALKSRPSPILPPRDTPAHADRHLRGSGDDGRRDVRVLLSLLAVLRAQPRPEPHHDRPAFLPQTLLMAVMSLSLTARLVKRFGNLRPMFAE
jgi:hypothetical protein